MELSAVSLSALRLVDEPFDLTQGHELEAEWLRSSRSGPKGRRQSAKSVFFISFAVSR